MKYQILVYGLTGDCPALKLILKHVNHQGYWPCWFCFLRGVHVGNKRQYYFEERIDFRSASEYEYYSKQAQLQKKNILGHLGASPLFGILDNPLPHCIVIDYMHVSLLRHTRTVIQYLYQKVLKPKQRNELDELLRRQAFPHCFNRRLRPVKEFSFCKCVNEPVRSLMCSHAFAFFSTTGQPNSEICFCTAFCHSFALIYLWSWLRIWHSM